MKIGRKIACTALLCTLVMGSSFGCKCGGSSSKVDADVWGAYSTVKVTQNIKEEVPYEKLSAKINIQMMKNETEGSQIIITNNDEDNAIEKYSLGISDLSDGKGNKIAKEDVTVYHQKYIEVIGKTDLQNENYLVGDMVPDMLLPLDIAEDYEENVIPANSNQGITVEVSTDSATVPGTYTGKFVLDLDGEKTDIPVTVEVWDIEYEGRRTFQSSYLIYRSSLLVGEYEASDDIVNRYIEFFLDYKVNSYVVQDSYNPTKFLAEIEHFFDNDNYNSICIPNDMSSSGGNTVDGRNATDIVNYIKTAVKASTPEKPYLDYLYIYPSYFDEADAHAEKKQEMEEMFVKGGIWDQILARALEEVQATNEYQAFSSDFKAHVDEVVLNIPAVVPSTAFKKDWISSQSTTFCPVLNLIDSDSQAQQYQDYAAINHDGTVWGYTCVGPTHPYPTFHIDDYNLGTRVTGWMSKKLNLDGYLYWASQLYEPTGYGLDRDINPYETAERAGMCAGDGYLVYPGAYYGSEYPFPSNRLAVWRDGMDDYDMLCVYENLLMEKAAEYGVTVNLEECINDLYDSIFAGTKYYVDDSLVIEARAELASRILALKSGDGLFTVPSKGKITVYSAQSTLSVDGSAKTGEASGTGYKYEVVNTGTTAKTITIVVANGTYTRAIAGVNSIALSNTTATATAGSDVNIQDGIASVTIASQYLNMNNEAIGGIGTPGGVLNVYTEMFEPYVEFESGDLSGITVLSFTVQNTGSEAVDFVVKFISGASDSYGTEVASGFVLPGATRTFRFDIDGRTISASAISAVTAIRLSFANINIAGTGLELNKTFNVSNVWCEIDR